MHRFLRTAAAWFALLGAAVGLLVGVMTFVSVLGRAWFSRPIFGDVELTQVGIALCISLCLPWCQLKRGHIIVDFFTQRLRRPHQWLLDAMGCSLIAIMYLLLAWRSAVGAQSVHAAFETTMILGLPMWWAYAGLVPGLLLSAVLALWQAGLLLLGFVGQRHHGPNEQPAHPLTALDPAGEHTA
ncbi:MAG: TRAP transporter small permease [Betaproteobacteria bacterium]